MDIRQVIGANARALRLARGLTQAQVATRLGVDRAHVSALEQGQRNPTAISLYQIATALETTVSSLVDERSVLSSETGVSVVDN
ncbi:HTH cro/C1-type domain-containing protein [Hyphomicrobiales bacterium]|nr:HTH cro/C1-type domain-containing protein [Hyphomicrobiales bacterium]CAH1699851.1 HTH cro/C1-type domain-containing protein [Hyphomicrobiales bacterium]CAI0343580.1 HTH cro/C1-type domain-containing protein [Hyphomicrobiales bacterium]